MQNSSRLPQGWGLFAGLALVLLVATAAACLGAATATEGARAAIRLTARSSLLLFSLAFVASALARRMPGPVTFWLRQNRRMFGLGFAASHFLHAVAIFRLWQVDPALFFQLTNPVSYVAGGSCYLVIAALAATSFARPRQWLGAVAWQRLHSFGMWYIWLFFLINFGRRAAMNSMYWPAMLIIFLALALRLIGRRPGQRAIGQAPASDAP